MTPTAKVHCEHCGSWVEVEGKTGHVSCSCGARFAVTVTEISLPSR